MQLQILVCVALTPQGGDLSEMFWSKTKLSVLLIWISLTVWHMLPPYFTVFSVKLRPSPAAVGAIYGVQ